MGSLNNIADKELRKFSITLFGGVLFVVIASLWKTHQLSFPLLILLIVTILLVAAGMMRPQLLRPLYKVWMRIASVLGFISTHIILTIIYYVILTPIAVIMRLRGKDPLGRRFDRDAESYWVRKSRDNVEKKQYEKMF